jgi:hypothetical protein
MFLSSQVAFSSRNSSSSQVPWDFDGPFNGVPELFVRWFHSKGLTNFRQLFGPSTFPFPFGQVGGFLTSGLLRTQHALMRCSRFVWICNTSDCSLTPLRRFFLGMGQ